MAGSFSKLVGVTVGGGVEAVEEDIGVGLGDEGGDGAVDRGTNELDGLVLVVAGRAGPITCCKCINRVRDVDTREGLGDDLCGNLSLRTYCTITIMYSPVW